MPESVYIPAGIVAVPPDASAPVIAVQVADIPLAIDTRALPASCSLEFDALDPLAISALPLAFKLEDAAS